MMMALNFQALAAEAEAVGGCVAADGGWKGRGKEEEGKNSQSCLICRARQGAKYSLLYGAPYLQFCLLTCFFWWTTVAQSAQDSRRPDFDGSVRGNPNQQSLAAGINITYDSGLNTFANYQTLAITLDDRNLSQTTKLRR